MDETAHPQPNRARRSARVLPLRRGPAAADPGLCVDPALVHIAQRQREAATLKAQQETARQLERLATAVERLVAALDQRRRVA